MSDGKTRLEQMRELIDEQQVRVTAHAQQEMTADAFTLDDIFQAIQVGQILEDYPEHRRGACCLFGGTTAGGRPLHMGDADPEEVRQ